MPSFAPTQWLDVMSTSVLTTSKPRGFAVYRTLLLVLANRVIKALVPSLGYADVALNTTLDLVPLKSSLSNLHPTAYI